MDLKNKKLLIGTLVALIVVGTSIGVWHFMSQPKSTTGRSGVINTIEDNAKQDLHNTSESPGAKDSNTNKDSQPAPDKVASSSSEELSQPMGSFVSNHTVSLSDATDQESVCLTTPGSSCSIAFMKDGVVKTLAAKTSDGTGSVIWHWNAKDAGLTTGNWQISATAKRNGQTKVTDDLQELIVKE